MTRRLETAPTALLLLVAIGCTQSTIEPPPQSLPPAANRRVDRDSENAPRAATVAKISWDTDRDKTFAEFLRDKSAGMIKQAAVGIERKGLLRVELDRSVEPDDTLGLTKSLMAGARKDFPDKPITLAVFDPDGSAILKAFYTPGKGVNYQIVHDQPGTNRPDDRESSGPSPSTPRPRDPLTRSGVTEADRKFAAWAEDHGKAYLRYVEADLEKHGRLWFGVNREVKPNDVPELTKSLLEGASKEFPRKELIANVFDPEGERIGQAHLGTDGRIRWDR